MNIKVNPETYKRFIFARARSNAATKRVKQLREFLNLPEASNKTKGEHILIRWKQFPIGKYTISARDGYEVKAGWTGKISLKNI